MVVDLSERQIAIDPSETTSNLVATQPSPAQPEVISAIAEVPIDQVEAEQAANLTFSEDVARVRVSTVPSENIEPGGIWDSLQARIEKDRELKNSSSLRLEDFLASKDPNVQAYDLRVLRRIELAQEAYQEAIAEINGSDLNDVGKFIDRYLLRYISTIGWYEALISRRSERESQDLREIVLEDMTDEEFKEIIKDRIISRRQEGIVADDNVFSIDEEVRALELFGGELASNEADFHQFFGVLDVALTSIGVNSSTITSLAAIPGNVVRKVGAIRGPSAGTRTLSNLLSSSRPIDDGTLSVLSQRYIDIDSMAPLSVIDQSIPAQRAARQELITELGRMNKQGMLGRSINPEQISTIAQQQADETLKRLGLGQYDINLRRLDNFDNYFWTVEIGRQDGTPWTRLDIAEKVATQFNGRVVRAGDEGYKVEISRNVNLSGHVEGYDLLLERHKFLGDLLGSASRREQIRLSALADQMVGNNALMSQVFEPYRQAIKGLKREEGTVMDQFFLQYRDGALSNVRQAPDPHVFYAYYRAHFNKAPSQTVINAYDAAIQLNDAAWKLAADRNLKRVQNSGYELAAKISGSDYILKPVSLTDLAVDDLVLDVATGTLKLKDQLSTPVPVYRTNDIVHGTIFVVNPKQVRPIVHSDVLPYNFGGPRTNADAQWFLLEEKSFTLANRKTIASSPDAVLVARTEKEINLAAEQINKIRAARKEYQAGNLTRQQMDDIVAENNTFNRDLQTLEDFSAWASRVNLREGKLATKARNAHLEEVDPGFNLRTGAQGPETLGIDPDLLRFSRKDKPLFEFGVGDTYNPDPLSLITNQFSSEAHFLANRSYIETAMEGWVKTARNSADVSNMLPGKDFIRAFMNARIDNPKTLSGKRLQAARNRILRRLNAPTSLSAWWDNQVESVSSALHNAGVLQKIPRWARLGTYDPSQTLMSAGFYTKFGFLNWDQFILQGFHVAAITAASPRYGSIGASMANMIRLAAGMDTATTTTMARRMAKAFNLTTDEVDDIIRLVRESGRLQVSNELIELGGNQRILSQNMLTRGLDRTTFFFKEGERHSRTASLITAFLEYKAKFPKADLFSDHFRAWVARRDNELTFNMTGAGRSALQANSIMKVATQWTSYTLRAMETVFFNKNMTAAERLRLGVYLLPMWGLTGLGIGGSAAYIADSMGFDLRTEEGQNAYSFLKYGVIDGLFNYMGIDNTAASVRFAPLGGVSRLIYDWSSQPAATTILGPSGSIVYDMGVPFFDMVGNVMHGRISMAALDFERLSRNITTVDKLTIAGLIYRNKLYRTKSGRTLPTSLGDQEFVTNVILGFPIKEVQEFYSSKSAVWWEQQAIQALGEEMNVYIDRAFRSAADGDMETASQLFEEAAEMVSLMEPHERKAMLEKYWSPREEDLMRIYRDLINTGQEAQARSYLGNLGPYLDQMTGSTDD